MFAKTGSLIAGMVVLSVAGCSSTEPSGTGATTVRTSVASGPVDFAKIPGQIPAEAEMTQQGSEEAPIGACVYLKGKPGSVTLNKVDCDSQDANYRVTRESASLTNASTTQTDDSTWAVRRANGLPAWTTHGRVRAASASRRTRLSGPNVMTKICRTENGQ